MSVRFSELHRIFFEACVESPNAIIIAQQKHNFSELESALGMDTLSCCCGTVRYAYFMHSTYLPTINMKTVKTDDISKTLNAIKQEFFNNKLAFAKIIVETENLSKTILYACDCTRGI